jgi:hypothetical protein
MLQNNFGVNCVYYDSYDRAFINRIIYNLNNAVVLIISQFTSYLEPLRNMIKLPDKNNVIRACNEYPENKK